MSARRSPLVLELLFCSRRIWHLSIERLAVPDAPPEELWPRGDTWSRVASFRQQSPQCWMMPTQLVSGAIAVLTDSSAQPLDLRDERLAIESCKVFVHPDAPG